VFDALTHGLSGNPLSYLIVLGLCVGDAVFPLFPAEVAVITAAVLAGNGTLDVGLVLLSAWVGAMLGDNTAYALGHSGLRRLADRLLDSGKSKQRLDWARAQLRASGAWIIVVARFIPGGRTATTYVSGTLAMPWKRRFLPADSAAALIWSIYTCALGYFGGTAFENNLWAPLLIATGASLIVAFLGEVLRRKVLDRRAGREGAEG
jgi:membrane-associated protein